MHVQSIIQPINIFIPDFSNKFISKLSFCCPSIPVEDCVHTAAIEDCVHTAQLFTRVVIQSGNAMVTKNGYGELRNVIITVCVRIIRELITRDAPSAYMPIVSLT